MGSFSLIHWIILGVIILLLFGGNRFSSMMSDVAKGLKNFKKGLSEDEEEEQKRARAEQPQRNLPRNDDRPIDVTAEPRRDTVTPPPGDDRTGR